MYVFNTITRKHRFESRGGKDFLIVPVTMIVEGVLNRRLVTKKEFGADPESWNGVPVTIPHPEIDNEPITAYDPRAKQFWVGTIYNAYVDGDKLRAEAHIDLALAGSHPQGEQVINQIKTGIPIEVSTGYFAELEEATGEASGRPYEFVTHSILPDHLALLPDEEGACSLKDGCGINNNAKLCQCGSHSKDDNSEEGNMELTQNEEVEIIDAEEIVDEVQAEVIEEEAVQTSEETSEPTADVQVETDFDQADLLGEIATLVNELGGVGALRDALVVQVNSAREERARNVQTITANSAISSDELSSLSAEAISKLAEGFEKAKPKQQFRVNYAANGTVPATKAPEKVEAYKAPAVLVPTGGDN